MEDLLYKALSNGDQKQLIAVLNESPELVNFVFEESKLSVFEIALKCGFSSIAFLIIDQKEFDLNHEGHNPLNISINLGYRLHAKRLLEKGANPNYRQGNVKSALLLCLENEYYELAEQLLKCGAEIDIRNETGMTPLIWCAYMGRGVAVDFLIKHGANPDLCVNDGWNAITGAYYRKHFDIVKKLQEVGAVFSDKYKEAAFLRSFENGDIFLIKQFISESVNPNIENKDGESPLMLAVMNGNDELVRLLLDAGANPNVRNKEGISAISILARDGKDDLITKMVEAGADVNFVNDSGQTAVFWAVRNRRITTISHLVDCGANLNAQDQKGNSPVICATKLKDSETLEKLIELGASAWLKNLANNTAYDLTDYRYDGSLRELLNVHR